MFGGKRRKAKKAMRARAHHHTKTTPAEQSDTATEFADRAMRTTGRVARQALKSAREAQQVASPVVRATASRSAEKLSDAAEKAAELLAETADRLAQQGADHAATASVEARQRLADASEALAGAVRPKRHWGRRFFFLTFLAAVGGTIAMRMSPVKDKIREWAYGEAVSDEPPASITLPDAKTDKNTTTSAANPSTASATFAGKATPSDPGNPAISDGKSHPAHSEGDKTTHSRRDGGKTSS